MKNPELSDQVLVITHHKEKDLQQQQQQQQQAKELIDQKNKEPTTTMLQLIEKEEIINTLSDHLDKFKNINSARDLLTQMKTRSVNLRDAFNSRFMEQNEEFIY